MYIHACIHVHVQWNLINMDAVKVKYVLTLNHSEIPEKHQYANIHVCMILLKRNS